MDTEFIRLESSMEGCILSQMILQSHEYLKGLIAENSLMVAFHLTGAINLYLLKVYNTQENIHYFL